MQTFWQDIGYAARMLRKYPGFTLVAVFTLALGIGANTAIFSVVEALLLRPLPYAEPGRLVMLSETGRDGLRANVSYPNFADWRERAQSFEGMASERRQTFNLTGVDRARQLRGRTVSWNFFHLLGVVPHLGRLFVAEEDRFGAARTALLGHDLWREQFGGDEGVIGRELLLDGEHYEVIGVLPPGFEYFRKDDIYVPIGLFLKPQSGMTDRGSSFGLSAVARLKPGVTPAQADLEMAGLAERLAAEYPSTNLGRGARADALQEMMTEGVRRSLWLLLGAVACILLIACANVANLLLAHTADRHKEIALRLALGAGRWRIVRQLLSESLLLSIVGGALGILLGRWLLDGLLALAPENLPQLGRVEMDGSVLLVMLGVALSTSLLCGLLPAWQASGTDLQAALKAGGNGLSAGGRGLTHKSLLVAEVALALVLLVGAGLLLRSMIGVLRVEPGFLPENLLTMRVSLPAPSYPLSRRQAFYEDCVARIESLPGVRRAALTISLPVEGSYWDAAFFAADRPVPPRNELPQAALVPVSENYFEAMGMRVLRGRGLTPADTDRSPRVAVVNESLARRIWPGEDPVGKHLRHGWPEYESPWREVVGVVADVKLNGLEHDTPMQAYLPIRQEPWSSFGIAVRCDGDPLATAAAVEQEVRSLDKDLPVFSIRSMDQLLGQSWSQRRLTLTLLMSLAGLALLLAAVGIYGVMSYAVKRRAREIGVRMALGAQTAAVMKMVLWQGLKIALLGILLGLTAASFMTRWLESLLFGVRPADPLTYAAIAAGLALVAILASYLPARRATKVDPLVAMRHE